MRALRLSYQKPGVVTRAPAVVLARGVFCGPVATLPCPTRPGRGGHGRRSFDKDAGESGADADLRYGTVPAGAALAAMVLVGLLFPADIASAVSGLGLAGWPGGQAKTPSLAERRVRKGTE